MRSEFLTKFATRILAPNPGPMTLEGTNTYIVRDPGSFRVVVVDPGPRAPLHVRELLRHGEIELILLTHSHHDHSEAAARLSDVTGAPVRGAAREFCVGAGPLHDEEEIRAAGVRLRVMVTAGHTSDSVCFLLPDDDVADRIGSDGSVLTGDTVLGRGTSVIAAPDGSLRDYMNSLRRLRSLGNRTVLPGHGPSLASIQRTADAYIEHRRIRLDQIRSAIADLEATGAGAVTVEALTDKAYPDLAPELRRGAEMSVAAHVDYLIGEIADDPVGAR